MSSLVKASSSFKLDKEKLEVILEQIKSSLAERVEAAYVFGSVSDGRFTPESDIDLILVVKKSLLPFVKRAEQFADLFEIWPKLDLLVYTQAELEQQLADSEVGFWKSARLSMKRVI